MFHIHPRFFLTTATQSFSTIHELRRATRVHGSIDLASCFCSDSIYQFNFSLKTRNQYRKAHNVTQLKCRRKFFVQRQKKQKEQGINLSRSERKATLLLTIPRYLFKSSANDLALAFVQLGEVSVFRA